MATNLCATLSLLCIAALLTCGHVWAGDVNTTPVKIESPVADTAAIIQEKDVVSDQTVALHTDGQNEKGENQAVIMTMKSEVPKLPAVATETEPGSLQKENKSTTLQSQQEATNTEADKKEDILEIAMDAEVLQQPGMARLARHLRSFLGDQLLRDRKQVLGRSANMIGRNDEEDEDVVPEERAVRRRKRIRRRNSKNKVKRTHRNKQFANRRKNARRKQSNRNSVRRRNVKQSTSRRRRNRNNGSSRRKSPSRRRSGSSKRRSSSKKSSRRSSNRKRKSNKRRRNKEDRAEEDTDRGRKQTEAVPVVEDHVVQEAEIVAPAA